MQRHFKQITDHERITIGLTVLRAIEKRRNEIVSGFSPDRSEDTVITVPLVTNCVLADGEDLQLSMTYRARFHREPDTRDVPGHDWFDEESITGFSSCPATDLNGKDFLPT